MVCSLPEGITLEFEQSGVIIDVEELDYRAEARNFGYASARVSERAGTVISENAFDREPCLLKFNGNIASRLMLPENGIEFTKSLDERTVANVELRDARYIMDSNVIDKEYEEFTLENVVQDILSERDDPHDVIIGYNFIDGSERNIERQSTVNKLYEASESVREPGNFFYNPLLQYSIESSRWFLQDVADNFIDTISGISNAIVFDEITPMRAMQKVMNKVSLSWWIDNSGVMQIGVDGAIGTIVGILNGENDIPLIRYSVTEPARRVDTVSVAASADVSDDILLQPGTTQANQLAVLGEATTTEFDGTSVSINIDGRHTPEKVENVAERVLYNKTITDIAGSLVINGLATKDPEMLATLDIGDYLIVDESIGEKCKDSDVTTGLMLVKSVNHRINRRQGWRVTVSVSRMPRPTEIYSNSVYYDASEDKEYETLDAYVDEGVDDPVINFIDEKRDEIGESLDFLFD